MKYEHPDRSWPIDPYRQPPTSTPRPHSAPPAPETLAAHARATVEADGAETWPEGLVEAVARAMWEGYANHDPWDATDLRAVGMMIDAQHALAAIRAWEGE